MSAGICILNKNAVAMAADSAVTYGQRLAIHNSANKLFPLSRIAPVGLITYSCGNLMGISMEIIVSEYRKQLGDKTFPTLHLYVDNFKTFLEKRFKYFRFDKYEIFFLFEVIFSLQNLIQKSYEEVVYDFGLNGENTDTPLRKHAYDLVFDSTIDSITNTYLSQKQNDSGYSEYAKKKYFDSIIETIKTDSNLNLLSEEKKVKLCDVALKLLNTDYESRYVGIAISGYGEEEVYPCIEHFHVDGVLGGKLRKTFSEEYTITELDSARIVPLAQTDVMNTFLNGIDNNLLKSFNTLIPNELRKYINSMDDNLFVKDRKTFVSDQISKKANEVINQISHKMINDNKSVFYKSIADLPIQELALFAESLINITSVRRMVVIDQVNSTVGGPTDVAIVSKGDGFIWLKNKKYFNKEDNPQYLYSQFKQSNIQDNNTNEKINANEKSNIAET